MNIEEKLKIALVQFDIVWENPDQNIEKLNQLFASINSDCDLVVLPELFTTGFTTNIEAFAESPSGKTVQWMASKAQALNMAICGSIAICQGDAVFNSFVFADPNGEITFYNKRHLFSMGNEQLSFTAGNKRVVVEYKNWRIMPIICYDLRFPVWCRNNLDYDLLLVAANWPTVRQTIWDTLLSARAIENQCFVCGVNRTGFDGNDIQYSGGSVVKNYLGTSVTEIVATESVVYQTIFKNELELYKQKFPAYLDRDQFSIKID